MIAFARDYSPLPEPADPLRSVRPPRCSRQARLRAGIIVAPGEPWPALPPDASPLEIMVRRQVEAMDQVTAPRPDQEGD